MAKKKKETVWIITDWNTPEEIEVYDKGCGFIQYESLEINCYHTYNKINNIKISDTFKTEKECIEEIREIEFRKLEAKLFNLSNKVSKLEERKWWQLNG